MHINPISIMSDGISLPLFQNGCLVSPNPGALASLARANRPSSPSIGGQPSEPVYEKGPSDHDKLPRSVHCPV